MAKRIITILFPCILILSTFGNGMGAYAPKYTDRGIYEKACEMDRNNKDIPEVWTGENLSHEEMSISFQIRKLLLYVHDHPVETTHGHYL